MIAGSHARPTKEAAACRAVVNPTYALSHWAIQPAGSFGRLGSVGPESGETGGCGGVGAAMLGSREARGSCRWRR